jgi:hypothetical protein
MVDTEADDFVSGVVVVVLTPGVPKQTEILLVLGTTHVTKITGTFTESHSGASNLSAGTTTPRPYGLWCQLTTAEPYLPHN